MDISYKTMEKLKKHAWPGNVRELGAVLERMIVLADDEVLSAADLPGRISGAETSFVETVRPPPETTSLQAETIAPIPEPTSPEPEEILPSEGLMLSSAVDRFETRLILQALERTSWNKNQAAKLLKMNRTTLVEKLKKKNLTQETAAAALQELED